MDFDISFNLGKCSFSITSIFDLDEGAWWHALKLCLALVCFLINALNEDTEGIFEKFLSYGYYDR